MKKLLIATSALVATAGMASADITISGHAAAGVYSGLDFTAATLAGTADASQTNLDLQTAAAAAEGDAADAYTASPTAANLAAWQAADAADTAIDVIVAGAAAAPATDSGDGVYSSAGVDFTMTGATDNGISFSATVNIDAGTEVDTGDFEFDGVDGGTAGLGAVSMSGTFGTLTFDEGGIDNLYDDATTHDVSLSTTIGAIDLTLAHSVGAAVADDDANLATSFSAGYSASGMAFTLLGSETAAGTSASLGMSYALNDTVTMSAKTDQVAGAESVQTIGAVTTLNGVSVSVSSANNSTWDVDLGYSAGGFALAYGVDETDAWTATATSDLGGGASFSAGVNSDDSTYAGVSFAF